MREEKPKRLTLQELRCLQKETQCCASLPANQGPRTEEKKTERASPAITRGAAVGTKRVIEKAKGGKKAKRRSNNSKAPREFSCRKQARTYGAVVLPDGDKAGPLLLAAPRAATENSVAPSREVEAYRAAVSAQQLKRLRAGLKRRSASARSRDPRFSSLCGDLNVDLCSKAYAFVEEQQQQVMKQLQHIVKTGRVPSENAGTTSSSRRGRKASVAEREQAARQLQRLQSQQQQRERRAAVTALKASLSRAERERIAATGKRPHYIGKKRLRDLLRKQQQQMTSMKRQIKHEIKRRKKALAKERKQSIIPQRRGVKQADGEE